MLPHKDLRSHFADDANLCSLRDVFPIHHECLIFGITFAAMGHGRLVTNHLRCLAKVLQPWLDVRVAMIALSAACSRFEGSHGSEDLLDGQAYRALQQTIMQTIDRDIDYLFAQLSAVSGSTQIRSAGQRCRDAVHNIRRIGDLYQIPWLLMESMFLAVLKSIFQELDGDQCHKAWLGVCEEAARKGSNRQYDLFTSSYVRIPVSD